MNKTAAFLLAAALLACLPTGCATSAERRQFKAENPDAQVIALDITGGYAPLQDWIAKDGAPDIVFKAAGFTNEETTARYFKDLSADPVIQKYEAAALQRTATGSRIYWLPGPSDICSMTYHKTLFEQYLWQVPATFDELRADGSVTPVADSRIRLVWNWEAPLLPAGQDMQKTPERVNSSCRDMTDEIH